MKRSTFLSSTALTPIASGIAFGCLLAACESRAPAATDRFQVEVAALTLEGIDNAEYTLTVVNHDGDTVWQKTVDADTYGDGVGSLSYVGPCDASSNPHTVSLTLDHLWDTTRELTSPKDYKNPGTITLADITCAENADTLVRFDLTLLRAAKQGFFDIAVNFDDVFCSAKVDCLDESLHKPDGSRGPTVVMGFACTSGQDEDGAATPSRLYLSDVTLTCTDAAPTVEPALAPLTQTISLAGIDPGQQGAAAPLLYQWAEYEDDEELANLDKCFWNHAFGLDLTAIGARRCQLTALGTASSDALTGNRIAGDVVWPIIRFDVEVLDAQGQLCSNNGLDVDLSGVRTGYVTPNTTPRPAAFAAVQTCGDVPDDDVQSLEVACGAGAIVNAAVASGAPGLRITVAGVASASYRLPTGARLIDQCCLADCCGTP